MGDGWDDEDDWGWSDCRDDDEPCEHPNLGIDVFVGTIYCGRCGYCGFATKAEIEAEMRFQAEYQQSVAEEHLLGERDCQ